MRTDTQRLDALQSMIDRFVVCRRSMFGRGLRLHECSDPAAYEEPATKDVREAIDKFLDMVEAEDERKKNG